MFSPKRLIGLLLTSFLFVSCTPFPKDIGKQEPATSVVKQPTTAQTKSSAELKQEAARIKANKEAAARRAKLKQQQAAAKQKSSSSSSSSVSSSTPTPTTTLPSTPSKPVVKPKSKYRTAMSIPGKPGFVFNPWTNKAVDVRGIPGGSVVRDPNDGNPDHKFRVP